CHQPMVAALGRIAREPSQATPDRYQLAILSDRNTSEHRVPLPSLLAVGAVHHHLVRHLERTKIGLVVESGEAREIHHFCLLFGYGADAVNPYLAFRAMMWMKAEGVLDGEYT